MELKDLRPSILELSREEALDLILKIRVSRSQNKRVIKEKAKAHAEVALDLSKLTVEQLEALVQNLNKERQ